MKLLCMFLLFISMAHPVTAFAELKPYGSKESGIESYDYDVELRWVDIKFRNSQTVYRYPRSKYGDAAMQMMIDLAKAGEGLNTFLNTLPREGYRRLQELPEIVVCGPEGGYPPDEWWHFPIKTRGQASAALAYAHWAPNPDGIRRCVCRHFDFPSCSKITKEEDEKSLPEGD